MIDNSLSVIMGGILASIVWFIVGGALYMNPITAKIYKTFENSQGIKKWKDTAKYLINMYIFGILIQCLLFALTYSFIKPILPGSLLLNTLFFGLILVAIKIFPRLFDMWLQTTYPNKLLFVELVNGVIGSFVIALILALTL
ncbi:MAG: hypothetical protein CVU81_01055 [Euryarchaeota archaeon HGW-Euryarchaeota-1]|nr:MAG: hypothetical protein CVU81_01055 [Euryarchaeota archaeon HGW-Euryarchaeota-1]